MIAWGVGTAVIHAWISNALEERGVSVQFRHRKGDAIDAAMVSGLVGLGQQLGLDDDRVALRQELGRPASDAEPGDRHGSGLLEGDVPGLRDDEALANRYVLRERTGASAEHLIARPDDGIRWELVERAFLADGGMDLLQALGRIANEPVPDLRREGVPLMPSSAPGEHGDLYRLKGERPR